LKISKYLQNVNLLYIFGKSICVKSVVKVMKNAPFTYKGNIGIDYKNIMGMTVVKGHN